MDLQLSDNVAAGIPRASAVLILNDHDTGYPFACMEARSSAPPGRLRWPPWRLTGSPAAGSADARRLLRGGPDRPLHPYIPGRDRLVVR